MLTMKEIIDFFEGMDENNGRIVVKATDKQEAEEQIFGDGAIEVLFKEIGDLEHRIDRVNGSVSQLVDAVALLANVVSDQENRIESLEKEIGSLRFPPQGPAAPEYTFTGHRDPFVKQPKAQTTRTTNTSATSEEQLRKDLRKLFGME